MAGVILAAARPAAAPASSRSQVPHHPEQGPR